MSFLKKLIRTKLTLTTRMAADAQIQREADFTVNIARSLDRADAVKSSKVPKMPGVDEDMRSWSILQILEHNVIVNRAYADILDTVASGDTYVSKLDPKKDVMPSDSPSFSIIDDFEKSVETYLEVASKYPKLRGTGLHTHPVFGPFDAHKLHAMFGFHLWIHRKQAEQVAKQIRKALKSESR